MCAQFGGARKIENGIRTLLIELEISDENSLSTFFPRVRDRSDIAVMKCRKSGVKLLSRTDHIDITYYQNDPPPLNWSTPIVRKRRIRYGNQETQTRRDCNEAKAG